MYEKNPDSFVVINAVLHCTTGKYFLVLGSIHDVEVFLGLRSSMDLVSTLFCSHLGHLSVIFLWCSGNLFHIGFHGNFELFVSNPLSCIPIAHTVFDPHFGLIGVGAYAPYSSFIISVSGIYNWLLVSGVQSTLQIYRLVVLFHLSPVNLNTS